MEIIVQKYELESRGVTYNITIQSMRDKLRLILQDASTGNPVSYYVDYTLSELAQLSSLFASVSSFSEATSVFENIIMNQKVEVEPQGEYIYLKVSIKKEGMEEYFTILLSVLDPNSKNTQSMFQSTMISYGNYGNQNSYQNDYQNNYQNYSYQSMYQNNVSSPVDLNQQYLSLLQNNNNNGQTIYSTTETSTMQQYSEIPQTSEINQANENISYNTSENKYNYEKVQKHKTKKKTVDKLTLSLKAQPKEEKEQPKQITQKKVVQTVTTTKTNTNANNDELEKLRNENVKLSNQLVQYKSQIELLVQENRNLQLKNSNILKNISNGNESEEILLLKEELEKYIKEINILRDELNEFEEYKRIKEEEIISLKEQMEELLINQKKIEDFAFQKQKEIEELKNFIDELIRKQRIDQSQYQSILKQKEQTEAKLEDQMLTIQDTRLEVVKGDIIQDVKELELLSRKISRNKKKIKLNLLYKATIDGDRAEVFHKKCDGAKSSLVLVKSANDKRFGGYTTRDWKGNSIEKKDNNAFVFSLDKMKIYDIIPGEDAIGCYPKYGPVFLGCQIRIYDEFFSQGGTTFEKGMNYNTQENFELTGGLKKFDIKDVEVYSIDLE
jgi:hypothetical protein